MFPLVDVRDVAKAHVAAAYKPDVKGRHILCRQCGGFLDCATILSKEFPKYPVPTSKVPKLLLLLLGPWLDEMLARKYVWNNVDVMMKCDNTKSKNELGIEYLPLEKTLVDMFQQAIDEGMIPKKE